MTPETLFMFFVFACLAVLHSAEEERNPTRCPAYFFCNNNTGNILSFPECGLYSVDCSESSHAKIRLEEGGSWHEFTSVSDSNMISMIIDKELQQRLERDSCNDLSPPNPYPISDISTTYNLTLFKCNHTPDQTSYRDLKLYCSSASHSYYISPNIWESLPPQCSSVQLPITGLDLLNQPHYNLTANFTLQVIVSQECYECYYREGICKAYKGEAKCLIPQKGENLRLRLGLGAVAGVVVLLIIFCCLFWNQKRQNRQNAEAFLRNYGPLQVKRYSYSDVKKMTKSFKEKLGQGGYGGVYKGKLKDGYLVAVKILNRSKGNGEEFMNEVAAISRTSHVNIVSLLGFCFEGSQRALIYEFMPNGSLEKFIFDANNPQKDQNLGWEALDRISLGIARGLEYLHRGCNTRILHFDIKPHNILLDENFSPKISDFGLAKICDRKESIVLMLGARGTAGYIAPEVFCRNFGGVSHKSDVYSYGMMLSEMVGGRRNINAEAEYTSEIYFPHWIYKRLELDEELGLRSIMNEEDKVRARKMIMVSLWCIQTDPSSRPAIRQVIEMLEGSVDSLEMPPKPYLSSPPKSPAMVDSSTTLVSIQ
ncbi:hypothetical protein M0R45_021842 [Rubus argutus]|uniref:non-specific serine/threonine protein kinase n=1 Tax=Rubus argutus TaxID=59490 RepID=A0AAW1XFJ3_RUBAR